MKKLYIHKQVMKFANDILQVIPLFIRSGMIFYTVPISATVIALVILVPQPLDLGNDIRQVTGCHSPSAINAKFNIENFHDGRTNIIFNSAYSFRLANPIQHQIGNNPILAWQQRNYVCRSLLASQAVGPPMDTTEIPRVMDLISY
jgi:cytochrome c peroxidase